MIIIIIASKSTITKSHKKLPRVLTIVYILQMIILAVITKKMQSCALPLPCQQNTITAQFIIIMIA